MASSEDDGEGSYHAVAQSVTNYYFVDDKDEPISFCVLPFQCVDNTVRRSSISIPKKQIFLHGTADDGLQKIYKQATAWKFELTDKQPQIWVLSKDNIWINLQKPRKSFEDTIRTILITINWLHFVKRNPERSRKSLWDYLGKIFSSCEVRPSENDLIDHLSLIRDAVKNDPTMSNSKYMVRFLENPIKRKAVLEDINIGSNAKRTKFIVDEDEESDVEVGAADEVEYDEGASLFDSVCCICDNGGEILCCEGRCLRSFHATKADGIESDCKSLGFSKAQVEALKEFLCENCKHKQHQCFACGMLGSSDKSSGAAEVIPCVSATCGYFYHPECVANLLYPDNGTEAEDFQKRISAGESFTCPAHKCTVCKQIENKEIPGLEFAVCRRCPEAYHRKCLPRRIAFANIDDEGTTVRAWDGLLPNNRVLIYCLKHRIEKTLGTPVRNHIIFPNSEENKKIDLQSANAKSVLKNRTVLSHGSSCEKNALKKLRQVGKVPFHMKDGDSTRKKETQFSREGFDSMKTQLNASRKTFNHGMNSESMKKFALTDMGIRSTADESKKFMGQEKLKPLLNKGSKLFKGYQQEIPISKFEKNKISSTPAKNPTTLPLDPESKKRIVALMNKIPFPQTLEELTKSHKVPSTHTYSLKKLVDKTITEGKVEGFVQAARTALQKLESGCSVEDAKAVCDTDILNQIIKWRNKLKVYIGPFLHGMRYTSFGRHFTKVNKLKEIVDKLHWYVKDGDMIVDFCCGANDFSWLMKEKLEETGKICSFKNFDVIHAKNDFSFEKRDWMTVQPKELLIGSKLIMGLNPPFGVKASLANKFIDKALEFQPKLLILIVPQETERVDRKRVIVDRKQVAYDLVWEDNEKLRGKSFYLPGSVDINDNQMDQWNIKAPPLYLWSRHDWTPEHKEIALKLGHASAKQQESHVQGNQIDADLSVMEITPVINYYGNMISHNCINDQPGHNNETEPEEPMTLVHKDQKEFSLPKFDANPQNIGQDGEGERRMCHGPCRKRSRENEEWQGSQTSVRNENLNIGWMNEEWQGLQTSARNENLNIGWINEEWQGLQTSSRNENLNIGWMNGLNQRDPVACGTSSWSVPSTTLVRKYGMHGSEECVPGLMEDNVDNFSPTPYLNESGGQDWDSSRRHTHLPTQETGFRMGPTPSSTTPYKFPDSSAKPSFNSMTSDMQPCPPQLDELNHAAAGDFAKEAPLLGSNSMIGSPGSSKYALGLRQKDGANEGPPAGGA